MSHRILSLHSSIRWILSCSSQTSLKRVIDCFRWDDVFCITACDRHFAKPNFLITNSYGIQNYV